MKNFLIAGLLMAAFSGHAQTVNDVPLKDIDVDYVQIVGTTKFMSNKVNVNIDFGQKTKFFAGSDKETVLKDADGKRIEFNSMIDALNFMSNNGYEYEDAYVITTQNQNVYHYVLKKKK